MANPTYYNIGTIYEGKKIYVQITDVKITKSNGLIAPVDQIFINVGVPDGVTLDKANIPVGTFDEGKSQWYIGKLYPTNSLTAEFIYNIDDECISNFTFTFQIDSYEACNNCMDKWSICQIYQGYSCCDFSKCGFTIVSFGEEDIECPAEFLTPLNPPNDPIDGHVYFESFKDCEAWWVYEDEDWVLHNSPIAPSGTLSLITDTLGSGHLIATHSNQVDPASTIFETITELDHLLGTGKLIATYNNENGDEFEIKETVTNMAITIAVQNRIAIYTSEDGTTYDIYETITSIQDTVVGHKIATYTDEDGTTYDINETITSIEDTIAGNVIARYRDEDGNTKEIRETQTSLVENDDLSLTYTNESNSEIDITSPLIKPIRYADTNPYFIGVNDYTTIVASDSIFDIHLPDPTTVPEGRIFVVKSGNRTTGLHLFIFATNALIDDSFYVEYNNRSISITLQSDGTNYWAISQFSGAIPIIGSYVPTYIPGYQPTYTPGYSPSGYIPNYVPTYNESYEPSYVESYTPFYTPVSYVPTYIPGYQPTYTPGYIPTFELYNPTYQPNVYAPNYAPSEAYTPIYTPN